MATLSAFPNPCLDHTQKRLNIHEYLVEQENATYFVRVCSNAMRDIGMLPKDVAVVVRAKKAAIGDIVLAVVDGEFTIKQLTKGENGNVILQPANPDFKPIEIKEGMDCEIWGVVTGSFRKYSP